MLSCKQTIFIVVLACIASCKPPAHTFNYKTHVNKEFFSGLQEIVGKNWKIDSIRVYRAELKEKLVERDAVPEYKLINEKSGQEYVDFVVARSFSHLYLFQLFTTPKTDDLVVYLGTSYSPDSVCTSLGPAYFGNTRIYQINVKRQLKVVKNKDGYFLENKKKVKMNWYADKETDMLGEESNSIIIKQIILSDSNKIAGPKPLIFNTTKIFNDSFALAFPFFDTIK